uniref:Putative secreted protein n=1 Tax=Anopheles triannulatus TaxID=58253 RepID=A0A2M4AVH3_9DIPT
MDEGRISTVPFMLLVILIAVAPKEVRSQPCGSGSSAQTDIITQRGTNQRDSAIDLRTLPAVSSSTPSAIKKDLFMSRGWGASGMPFSMLYLNHYTKAQRAYAQSQLQQQLQMQQREIKQQNQHLQTSSLPTNHHVDASPTESQEELGSIHSGESPVPKLFPYGTRFDEPVTIVPEASVQAEKLRSDNDYIDNSSAIWRGPNTNASRRQYTVPQLFVSYGWGPMG